MYINKLIKKQVMLILATIVLVGTLAVTTSFAVFEETKSNATDQKMTIGDLDVTYTGGSAISITDINSMTDSTALSKTNNIYTFTIKNTGTVPYNFKVKVINNSSYTTNLLPHQYIRYSLNSGTASTLGTGQDDYELTSGVIEAGATNTYTLRLWVADAATYKLPNSALGQEIHLKISVEGKAGNGWIPSNFKDRILAMNEIKSNFWGSYTSRYTTQNDAAFSSATDDYGTTYYFSGNVKNNYVQFANKCWRIVRIIGDGSIKLALHNDNISNASNPCSSANNSDGAAFAHYDENTYTSAFNSNSDDKAYIGFMYGTAGSSDYASTHANTNKSAILTNLETWYKNNLVSYSDKLADTIWCNDKTVYEHNDLDPLGIGIDTENYGVGKNGNYYNSIRLIANLSYGVIGNATLKCQNSDKLSAFTVSDTIKGNGKLTYKIGLLTADELVYAGTVFDPQDHTYKDLTDLSYYLTENVGNYLYWTMTPMQYSYDSAQIIVSVPNTGALSFGNVDYKNMYVRPAISLLSTITATGTGTSEDPYVVQ